MKPLPLLLFGAFVGILTLSTILGDRTHTDVLPIQESQGQENLIDPSISLRIEATLTVEGETYPVSLSEGSSVYELMSTAEATSDFRFKGREFPGLGFFIQEINGLEQSPRLGKYWMYYINGKKAEVGISAYTVKANDIISWKYEHEE